MQSIRQKADDAHDLVQWVASNCEEFSSGGGETICRADTKLDAEQQRKEKRGDV